MISLNSTSSIPLYLQIYNQLKEEIQTGRIATGTMLPGKRKLAAELCVSVNTVDNAYEQLLSEGYLEARERKGFFVLPALRPLNFDNPPLTSDLDKPFSKIRIDFALGEVDKEGFPFATWRKLLRDCWTEGDREMLLRTPPHGYTPLRRQLRDYLYKSRGVNCRPEQIIIGAGTDALLNIISKLLPKISIAVENPVHGNAYRIFCSDGRKTIPVPVDEKGLSLQALQDSQAQGVYLTPSHQFPLGISMPVGRRWEILHWAERHNAYIIEDDYDSEFRYDSRPLPCLQGLDPNGRVIYLGTFSQSVSPALRVAYMVLPENLLTVYQGQTLLGSAVSTLEQRVLTRFMSSGYFEKHLNKMRKAYKQKRALLEQCLVNSRLKFSLLGEVAGQHLLLNLQHRLPWQVLQEQALAQQVKVYPLANYYLGHLPMEYERCLLLGYGGLTIEEIKLGVNLLAKAWQK